VTLRRLATSPTERDAVFVFEDARGVRFTPSSSGRTSACRSCAPFSLRRTSSSTLTSSPFCPPSRDETGDVAAAQPRIDCTACRLLQHNERNRESDEAVPATDEAVSSRVRARRARRSDETRAPRRKRKRNCIDVKKLRGIRISCAKARLHGCAASPRSSATPQRPRRAVGKEFTLLKKLPRSRAASAVRRRNRSHSRESVQGDSQARPRSAAFGCVSTWA